MSSFTLFLTLILHLISSIINAQSELKYSLKGNANCGDTLKGSRTTNEFIYYSFQPSSSYDKVYIETCLSDHDTVLYLFNSNGIFMKSADDINNHPNPATCTNQYSGDLTINGHVSQSNSYYFGMYGYSPQDIGDYTITIHCENNTPSQKCDRHRKPWHQLTENERNLYIEGFFKLSQEGKMKIFTATHVENTAESQAHGTSAFLPWHRWFVYELESQIRNLGGKFKCFSMPYWDWTYEVSTRGTDVHQFHILNSGLGHTGNPNDNYCITRGTFRKGNYETFWCDNDSSCCLRRNPRRLYAYPGASDMMRRILNYRYYGGDSVLTGDISSSIDGYRESLEGRPHAVAHTITGGGNEYHLGSMYSPDDPIFYLLHTFIDYQWSLWQDCHDFDIITQNHITNTIYNGGLRSVSEGGPSRIDDKMLYPILDRQEWSLLQGNDLSITPRIMHSIQSEYMSYSYEKGSFWLSGNVDRFCNNINSNWFYNEKELEIINRRLLKRKNANIFDISNDIDEFGRISYELIFNELKMEYGENNEMELFDTWADMQCEYEERGLTNDCKIRPRYFEDCIAMKNKKEFKGKKDIQISLKELLNKKGLTKCMKNTRKLFYYWANKTFQLYRLCNGDFDQFCDHYIDKNEADQITCVINHNNNNNEIETEEDIVNNKFALFLLIGIQTMIIIYLVYKNDNSKNIKYVMNGYSNVDI